jgi:hypothetical protein
VRAIALRPDDRNLAGICVATNRDRERSLWKTTPANNF